MASGKKRPARIDLTEVSTRLLLAAIPEEAPRSNSLAVDWTDIESWGSLHGDASGIELDGDEPPLDTLAPRRATHQGKVRVLGIGADNRKILTADPDARGGHRSATASRRAGLFTGYYLHLGVQTRDVRSTNYIDDTRLGPGVPPLITVFALTPAGAHPTRAMVPRILQAKNTGQPMENVVFDRGYTQLPPETWQYPLLQAGVHQTFDLVEHQRGPRPFAGDAHLVDGTLFSKYLPPELGGLAPSGGPAVLPMPPMGSPLKVKQKYEEAFNRRARWRLGRHGRPHPDGTTRWRDPFSLGLLRSRQLPWTMRGSRRAPLVDLPNGADRGSKTLTATPGQLPLDQRIPFGTGAWRIAYYGRRNVVENVNGGLKGRILDMRGNGFFRVLPKKRKGEETKREGINIAKMTLLIGPFLAAYNYLCSRSFLAEQRANEEQPTRRSPRRVGTWRDLIPRGPKGGTQPDLLQPEPAERGTGPPK